MNHNISTKAVVLVLSLLASACGGGNDPTGWSGTWSCSVTDTVTVDGQSNFLSWRVDLAVTEASDGKLTVTPIDDAGAACSWTAKSSGDVATLDPTQSCDSASYSGTLRLDGNAMTMSESSTSVLGFDDEEASCARK